MTALIVIGCIFGYAMVGGALWSSVLVDESEPQFGRFFAALFWPLAFPVVLGILSARQTKRAIAARRERRLLPEAREVRR